MPEYIDSLSTSSPDWSTTADDYAEHRAGFPELFFDRFTARGFGLPGQRIADVGTGTGTLARGFARRGAEVTAIDVAADSLAAGERLAQQQNLDIRWLQAPAENTGLPEAWFDVVCAGQCWHWFDRPKAAAEARRLLRPSGRLLIAHFDYLDCAITRDTARVLRDAIKGALPVDPDPVYGLQPRWLDDCAQAGFTNIESGSFDVATPYTRESWRGRMRASNWIARLTRHNAAGVDDAMRAMLESHPESFAVPHRVFAVWAVA